jgi:5'-nucleotidase
LIADAIKQRARTDIAFINSGAIRPPGIPVGNVTLSDLLSVNPFQNTIATFDIRGSDIPAILINSVSRAENRSNSGTGRFLQIVRRSFL